WGPGSPAATRRRSTESIAAQLLPVQGFVQRRTDFGWSVSSCSRSAPLHSFHLGSSARTRRVVLSLSCVLCDSFSSPSAAARQSGPTAKSSNAEPTSKALARDMTHLEVQLITVCRASRQSTSGRCANKSRSLFNAVVAAAIQIQSRETLGGPLRVRRITMEGDHETTPI